jgi:hypothetical protein
LYINISNSFEILASVSEWSHSQTCIDIHRKFHIRCAKLNSVILSHMDYRRFYISTCPFILKLLILCILLNIHLWKQYNAHVTNTFKKYQIREDDTDVAKYVGVVRDLTFKCVCNLCIKLVLQVNVPNYRLLHHYTHFNVSRYCRIIYSIRSYKHLHAFCTSGKYYFLIILLVMHAELCIQYTGGYLEQ